MKIDWFPWIYNAVLALFMGMLVYVTFIAYARDSGSAGLDMAKIQKTRYQGSQQQQLASDQINHRIHSQ
jgi:hypothetical protein